MSVACATYYVTDEICCWLRFFLRFFLRFPDDVMWTLLRDFGTQEGINTDDLERLLYDYDLLDEPDLFFFEPAGTGIGTDGSMHHLADGGHAQLGAMEMTARQVVAAMKCSDKRLGSGKCEGGVCREKSIKTMYEAKEKEQMWRRK
jgi:hypothetical protein